MTIGGRALDILLCLVERAGEVVGRSELVEKVWPTVTVEDGSLRFHVAALRKALGDGKDGARYIANVPGRGYCFVAPFTRDRAQSANGGATDAAPILGAPPGRRIGLPARLPRLIGRDAMITAVGGQLLDKRFVSIVGPAGIGKTMLALAVAHRLVPHFDGSVYFADLAPVTDPAMLPSTLASLFGLSVRHDDPEPSLIRLLEEKPVLVIIDCCEHVVEAVALWTERMFAASPRLHILTTSRESLRVEGEHVYRLFPLDIPTELEGQTAADAIRFPSVQLFVERAAACVDRFELNDADAPIVSEICRRLDGIALAIELAAGRVEAYGVYGISKLLDDHFKLFTRGRRTALPRHQTLSAALDWSYDLLTDGERAVLRRVASFAGSFTFDAIEAVAADGEEAQLIDIVADLAAKSLIAVEIGTGSPRYRLLATTRAYMLAKLADSGELSCCFLRQAEHFCRLLQQAGEISPTEVPVTPLITHGEDIVNIRACLVWMFSAEREPDLGAALAAAAAPLFLELSLLTECHAWARRAIEALPPEARGSSSDMKLYMWLGISITFTEGNTEDAEAALLHGLAIARAIDDRDHEFLFLEALYIFQLRVANFHAAAMIASDAKTIADDRERNGKRAADWMLASSDHFAGNYASARRYSERELNGAETGASARMPRFGINHRIHAHDALARTLWIQGYPDQAIAIARRSIDEAQRLGHGVSSCITLLWTTSLALWVDDLAFAEQLIDALVDLAQKHSLPPYHAVGLGWKGVLSFATGDCDGGVKLLQASITTLASIRYKMLKTVFLSHLSEGLIAVGEQARALATIRKAADRVACTGELLYWPEVLRIQGDVLRASKENSMGAEEAYQASLRWSRQQAARSFELRTATRLADLWHAQGRTCEARALLAPVYGSFTEGFETGDLKKARMLIDRLS
ncbi:putative ATPase [Rhizobium sp. BK313]|uniref:ATP-binding protein n=1 Tax=Rhizobium sp. BK313 TaxID=2587081 RepID=UPI001414F05D|nr:winged helix-turn-helix domain-containing protein [Rhizobium sp. BK313]MBB3452501.1 putative ATPase [Rhizobium sp. BK313]